MRRFCLPPGGPGPGRARGLRPSLPRRPLGRRDVRPGRRLGRGGQALVRGRSSQPRVGRRHNNLGVAYEKRGDWDAARREYEEALRLDPGNLLIKENFEAFKVRLEAGRGRTP